MGMYEKNGFTLISTHTPHARRDKEILYEKHFTNISTHTPHARRDQYEFYANEIHQIFQLTRLMRGVTLGRFAGSL